MKFRTDFVTNSSSSSFITVILKKKDASTIHANSGEGWELGDYFPEESKMRAAFRKIKSGKDLLDYINKKYRNGARYFKSSEIESISDFADIEAIYFSDEEQGGDERSELRFVYDVEKNKVLAYNQYVFNEYMLDNDEKEYERYQNMPSLLNEPINDNNDKAAAESTPVTDEAPRDPIVVEAHCLKQLIENCLPKDKIIVKIPKGIKRISCRAFCSGTKDFYLTEEEKAYRKCIVGAIIPDGVESIGYLAFYGCENLTNIELPESLHTFEHGAFWDCKKLQSFTFPKSLRCIEDSVFDGIDTDFEIPDTVYYGELAWTGNTKAESRVENGLIIKGCAVIGSKGKLPNPLIIPEGIRSIKSGAFVSQDGRTRKRIGEVVLPDSLVEIGKGALKGAKKITNLPKNLRYIGENAFSDCKDTGDFAPILNSVPSGFPIFLNNGKVVYMGGEYRTVNGLIYQGTVLVGCAEKQPRRVVIEPGTTETQSFYFDEKWAEVEEIVFPESLKTVSGFTFRPSDIPRWINIFIPSDIPHWIKMLTFSEGLEVIDSDSFNYLDELEEVTLPDSVKIVGNNSFAKLYGDRVRISASKNTVFEEYIGTSIFSPVVTYRD